MNLQWTFENDFDADPFRLDQRGSLESDLNELSTPWKVIRIKEIWIGNSLNIQVLTRLVFQPLSNVTSLVT